MQYFSANSYPLPNFNTDSNGLFTAVNVKCDHIHSDDPLSSLLLFFSPPA